MKYPSLILPKITTAFFKSTRTALIQKSKDSITLSLKNITQIRTKAMNLSSNKSIKLILYSQIQKLRDSMTPPD